MLSQDELVHIITQKVIEQLHGYEKYKVPVGVSNKHIHLSREDLDVLFGTGYELTIKKNLKQPGQYASEETVTIRGPKGEFKSVRILGPVRDKTQLEISKTDSFKLGINPPIKESGDLRETPGAEIVGPKGKVKIDQGTIIALRHIHMTEVEANKLGLVDGEFVNVETFGDRKSILSKVLVRVSNKYALEMHIDTDEANAVGLSSGDEVFIIK